MARSKRLNKYAKEDIVKKMVDRKFDPMWEAFRERYAALADKVYNRVYSKKVREKMEELPQGWLRTQNEIHCQFGEASGGYAHLRFDGLWGNHPNFFTLRNKLGIPERRMPAKDCSRCVVVFDDDDELSKEYHALVTETEAAYEHKREAERGAWTMVNSVTTAARLIEIWPECEEFAKRHLVIEARALPTIEVKKLNELLDLPPKEAA